VLQTGIKASTWPVLKAFTAASLLPGKALDKVGIYIHYYGRHQA
jgi:hypothetical protein